MWRAASGTQRQFPEAIADWMEAHQVIEADAVFAPSEFISWFMSILRLSDHL